jgi:hypothetical protein
LPQIAVTGPPHPVPNPLMDSPTAYPTGQDKAEGYNGEAVRECRRTRKENKKDLELTIMKSHIEVKAIRNKLEEITYIIVMIF